MPRRSILTERQRSALFDLPTDETLMLRHYTLADDDIEHINERRRPENKIGFALQLCALRYPARLLSYPMPHAGKPVSSTCTPFARSMDSRCSRAKARGV